MLDCLSGKNKALKVVYCESSGTKWSVTKQSARYLHGDRFVPRGGR